MLKWYAVNTYSGREDAVMAELRRRISLSPSSSSFNDIKVPKYLETKKVKGGKTRTTEKVTMPGYVLVHMDVSNKMAESLVRNTQGVIGFVGIGGNPSPLSNSDIANIMGKSPTTKNNKVEELYKVGDMVEFIDGPFISMDGRVEDIMDGKLKVSVEGLFERTIEIEVEINQVRKSAA